MQIKKIIEDEIKENILVPNLFKSISKNGISIMVWQKIYIVKISTITLFYISISQVILLKEDKIVKIIFLRKL